MRVCCSIAVWSQPDDVLELEEEEEDEEEEVADHHSSRQSGRTASLHTAHTTASNRAGSTHTGSSLRLAPAIQGGPTSTSLAGREEEEAVPGYSAPAADSSVSVGSNGYATEKKPASDAGRGSSSGTPRAASVASGNNQNETSRPQSTTDRSEKIEDEETPEQTEERKEEDQTLNESSASKFDF